MKRMGNKKLKKSGIKIIVGTFLGPFIQGTLLFVSAGHINIPRAWVYLVVSFVGMFGGITLVGKVNPELLNHRGQWKKKTDTKRWDKFLVFAFGITGFYILPVVIGLDIRFQWSYLGINFTIAGIVLFIVGSTLVHWAMIVNTHFETTVRIQKDRGHKVITTGPYKMVRHPGYVGAILWAVSAPLIIGSVYGLIPAGIAGLVLIIRTSLEDKTLQTELNGYAEYAGTVKYRLLPGIW
ncbi:MAG TPA: isoprenylcysteine carboxylmethyltransferase family protein [Sedimentisphaerales bacterium]|nr:isoprenylcysteine carboxylmethyltransferase family protein [Sedimentisphaerales bacterium]